MLALVFHLSTVFPISEPVPSAQAQTLNRTEPLLHRPYFGAHQRFVPGISFLKFTFL